MSLTVPLYGFGIGQSLNFKVVCAQEEPVSPQDNTLWVKTNGYSGYVFSSSQPSNPMEGLIWFETAASGGVEFNALKKNVLQVYLVDSYQYLSGNWVDIPTKLFRNEWIELWNGRIYWDGKDYKEFTGGISVEDGLQYTENDKSFTVKTVVFGQYVSVSVKNVDLTTYDTMKINITDVSCNYGTSPANATAHMQIVQNGVGVKSINDIQTTGAREYSIDVSDVQGEADLYLYLYSHRENSSVYISVTVDKWWLERNPTSISTTELNEAFYNGVNSI